MSTSSIYKSSFILISLIPIFLVTGPLLSDLSVVLVNLLFFYLIIKEKKFSFFKNKFFLFFLFFCIYLILRSFFTINFVVSLKSILFYFRFVIFSIMVFWTIKNFPNFFKYFSIIFLITFSFVLFDSIFQFFFDRDIFGLSSGHKIRISGPFGDELILGSYLSRFAPFLIFFFYYIKKPLRYLFLFIFLLGFVVTVLSAERTGLIYYLLNIIFFFLYSKEFKKIKIGFSIVVLFISFLVFSGNSDFKKRIITQAYQNSENATVWFSVMHDSHIRTAYNMFIQNPIMGVGPKMFRYHCAEERYEIKNPPHPLSNKFRCSTHPHNLFIQIAAETGVIGLFFYLLLFFYVIFNLCKDFIFSFVDSKKLEANYKIFFLFSFFITLWPIAPSGNIFNNWLSIIFFYPLGFYLYFRKSK